jgi:hypothetical protein
MGIPMVVVGCLLGWVDLEEIGTIADRVTTALGLTTDRIVPLLRVTAFGFWVFVLPAILKRRLQAPPPRGLGQATGFPAALVARGGRPGSISGQFEHRQCAAEMATPVGELSVEHRPGEPLALPGGEVGELDGERWQGSGEAEELSIVEGHQLPPEYAERPLVAHDVMHVEQEHVVGGTEAEQERADHRAPGQVERSARLFPEDISRPSFP